MAFGLLGYVAPYSVMRVDNRVMVVTQAQHHPLGYPSDEARARRNTKIFRWVISTRLFGRFEYIPVLTDGNGRFLALDRAD